MIIARKFNCWKFLLLFVAKATIIVSSFSAVEPLLFTNIDYSAGIEYVQVHYGDNTERNPYFGSDQRLEPIFDARRGVYDLASSLYKTASIDTCGFELIQSPSHISSWKDMDEIREKYIPELRQIFKETYKNSRIIHTVFWNPMLRGEHLAQTRPKSSKTPTARYAASPHIDTDVGAHINAEHLISLFEKNRIQDDCDFPREELITALESGHRFAIVNAWRNIASHPVARAPLALYATHYDRPAAFPDAAPNTDKSRWYIFSELTKDEVLLFCQYDRDVNQPSDLWHCALTSVGHEYDPPRQSFHVRCLIVFDEVVPAARDRFGADRLGSFLTQQESAEFCSAQAAQRQHT